MGLVALLWGCGAAPSAAAGPGGFDSGGPAPDLDTGTAPVEETGGEDTGAPAPLALCINEFMPKNHAAWYDDAAVASDWIELANPGTAAVSLGGWSITDDRDVPDKARLSAEIEVPAGGFVRLWADALGEAEDALPFALGADGGTLALYAPDGQYSIVTYGSVAEDWSAARTEDCGSDWDFDWHGTPGVSNALTPFTLVERGGEWLFVDTGEYPGEGWSTAGFDDRAWSVGRAPFGYGGDGTEARTLGQNGVTTWFRQHLVVEGAADIGYLTVQLHRDDGAVLYVNGVEIGRSNMDDGAIGPTTLATVAAFWDQEDAWWSFDVDPGLLGDGDNVIAVEVHQASTAAEDMIFDLGIVGQRAE